MKSFFKKILIATILICPFAARADINIAIVSPMSGSYKYYSEELIDGAKIAVDEINNRGGLQGRKVNLVPVDDPCDDVLSLSTAQMMALNKSAEDKMYLVIGPHCTNVADQVADLLHKAEIVQIHPTSISKAFYSVSNPNVVRFAGYKEDQARGLAHFVVDHYPSKKMAVIYDENSAEMRSIVDAIGNEYTVMGKTGDVLLIPYAGDKGISGVVDKVLEINADIVYVMGKYDNVLAASERLRNRNDKIILLTDRYQLSKKFIRKTNELSKESLLFSLASLKNNPNFASSLVRLRLWGIEPEGLMPYGYLSVKMWADMVNRAKSFKYARVLKQLNNRKVATGWGNVVFEGGVPKQAAPFTVYRIRKGEYTQVK